MARDPASGIWIERAIAWEAGSSGSKLGHPNKAVVALAAKMARIIWVVLNKPGALYERWVLSADASGVDCKAPDSDDETVDQHAVSPLQKKGRHAGTICGERRAGIS